jgi:hypothetical protein
MWIRGATASGNEVITRFGEGEIKQLWGYRGCIFGAGE